MKKKLKIYFIFFLHYLLYQRFCICYDIKFIDMDAIDCNVKVDCNIYSIKNLVWIS